MFPLETISRTCSYLLNKYIYKIFKYPHLTIILINVINEISFIEVFNSLPMYVSIKNVITMFYIGSKALVELMLFVICLADSK